MPCVECLDDLRLPLLHRREVEPTLADLDAVRGELVLRAVKELGGLEQRLRRNAAGVQAGAAEGVAAVLVLPFVDAGDLELVLGGADRAGIAGGTAADDDDVVLGIGHPESVAVLRAAAAAAPDPRALP